MGIFSLLFNSLNKSKHLYNLQRTIHPYMHNTDIHTLLKNYKNMDKRKVEKALEEYLDLCEADEGVSKVMQKHKLKRSDLKNIYSRLVNAGLGQWINGHFAALSSIAYFEPLYVVAACAY